MMKKIKNIKKKVFKLSLMMVMVLSLSSCLSEFSNDEPLFAGPGGPPIINTVSEALEDVVVTQGTLESTYIIRGENLATLNAVWFNGYPASLNPTYVTDDVVFITVPENAPYVGQANIMRLQTQGGSIDYDFSLLKIDSFTEGTVDGAKVVNIIGGDFTDTESVTFVSGSEEDGNLEEKPANILSVTETVVVAEVPPGVEQAFIYLETSRGAIASSDSYGFSYSIYIDAMNPDWSLSGWGGSQDPANADPALGEYSVKSVREAWSGLTFWPDDATIVFSDYQFLTVTIYGTGAEGDTVNLALNDFAASVQLTLVPGQWTKFLIPLQDFYPSGGAPEEIFRIDFQESSNTGLSEYIFYVDDFGFI